MSTLLWFILIAAFMFFMHRGRSAGGGIGCCGGHAHGHRGSHDHNTHHDGRDHHHHSKPNLEAIPDAEYEEVE